jgi:hypothetical protein
MLQPFNAAITCSSRHMNQLIVILHTGAARLEYLDPLPPSRLATGLTLGLPPAWRPRPLPKCPRPLRNALVLDARLHPAATATLPAAHRPPATPYRPQTTGHTRHGHLSTRPVQRWARTLGEQPKLQRPHQRLWFYQFGRGASRRSQRPSLQILPRLHLLAANEWAGAAALHLAVPILVADPGLGRNVFLAGSRSAASFRNLAAGGCKRCEWAAVKAAGPCLVVGADFCRVTLDPRSRAQG